MDRKVADIDFDDVMDQEHPQHAVGIHGSAGVFAQQQGVHRQVPGMLRRVLPAAFVEQRRLPDDGFQAVDFPEEIELLFQCGRLHDVPDPDVAS